MTWEIAPNKEAVRVNSGSTNTIGDQMYVTPSGQVNYVDGHEHGQGQWQAYLTRSLFNDINAAIPLSKFLVKQSCVKTVLFGTSTTIQLGVRRTPDFSCCGDSKVRSRIMT